MNTRKEHAQRIIRHICTCAGVAVLLILMYTHRCRFRTVTEKHEAIAVRP